MKMGELDAYANDLAKRKFRQAFDGDRYLITDTVTGEQRYVFAGNANTIWANAHWPKSLRTQLELLWINGNKKEAAK
jgi:hypothetical protein